MELGGRLLHGTTKGRTRMPVIQARREVVKVSIEIIIGLGEGQTDKLGRIRGS
jgi:hypothetical protein